MVESVGNGGNSDNRPDSRGALLNGGASDSALRQDRPQRPRFGSVAIIGAVATGFLIAALAAVILGALLRIVTIAEKAEQTVVPLVIQQHNHAVMASDLARVAEVILGSRSREERVAALQEAELIAHRFASVADTSVLSRLDSALHAVRRSAYRADVLDALNASAQGHLRRIEAVVPFDGPASLPSRKGDELLSVYAMRHILEAAQQAENGAVLDRLRDRFDVVADRLRGLLKGGPIDLGAGQPMTLATLEQVAVVFDLRREYLVVVAQVQAETATARRLLAELSGGLSADAAATASQSSSEIVSYGRNGIAVGAVALTIGLLVLALGAWFISRHVINPVLRAHAALEAVQRGERPPDLPSARLEEFDAVGRSVERLFEVLTELKDKERQALRSRQQLQFIFDVSPIPFLMTGVDNSIVMDANKALCALFRVGSGALVGRPVKDFWVQPQRMDEMIAYLRREGRVDNFEAHLMAADGREFWAVLSTRVVELDSGKVMLIGLYDITERKAYEARLHSLVTELEASNGELEQFAYVTSHDLQEPLRMVTSYLQLLERRYSTDLTDEAREFIGFAVDGARRMQQLIIDLLDYSRIGRDTAPERLRMDGVLDDVCRTLRVATEESGATIQIIRPMPCIHGVRADMQRLLTNLIGNAIKYRAPDRAPVVTVSAERTGHQWLFTVSDNGIGISPEHAERVFLIFQRLHGQTAYAGTGIGLAICRKIVELHGGRIWLDTSLGDTDGQVGATFHFTLPDADAV